jgi:hypothetical protein
MPTVLLLMIQLAEDIIMIHEIPLSLAKSLTVALQLESSR